MSNKKILFRIGSDHQFRLRFGEFGSLFHTAYLKGKDLGYEDNNIFIEWPLKIAYSGEYKDYTSYKRFMKCPSYSILPIKFIEREDVNLGDYDRIVDFMKPNSLYDNSPPIFDLDRSKRYTTGFMNYLNVHYSNTGNKPLIPLEKDKIEKPYILIHVRIGNWAEYKNPNLRWYLDIYKWLREEYGDKYEIWKTGEPFRVLDRKMDFVAPLYWDDINKFIKLVNNSSMVICAPSGPHIFATMFDIPFIEIGNPKKKGNEPADRTEEAWKSHNGIGKTPIDWRIMNEDYAVFWGDEPLEKERFMEFTNKWL